MQKSLALVESEAACQAPLGQLREVVQSQKIDANGIVLVRKREARAVWTERCARCAHS